jgi:hypothetical protein
MAVFALALAIFGAGNGMVLTSVNVATQAIAAQTIAKAEDRAMAACMYGFMRSLGMPIGIAVCSVSKHCRQSLTTRLCRTDHSPSCPGPSSRMR